jgi:hypothetical protein
MVGNLLRRTHHLASSDANFVARIEGFDVLTKAIAGVPLSTAEVLDLDTGCDDNRRRRKCARRDEGPPSERDIDQRREIKADAEPP